MSQRADERIEEFFDRQGNALLDRDATAIAKMYAVPSLIAFPGNVKRVSSVGQTEECDELSK